MRKFAFVFVACAILASVIYLTVRDADPEAEAQHGPRAASSGTGQTGPMDVQPATNSQGAALSESPRAQEDAEEVPYVALVSIPTPPEFDQIPADKLFWHHDSWRQLHKRLEGEPIDPEWSRTAESDIYSAINEIQEITRHGNPTISCRTETCQVQMLAYGSHDIDEGEWSTRFGAVVNKLRADFEIADFSVAQTGDTAAMVLHLSKRE
jgi:hypothetical protein